MKKLLLLIGLTLTLSAESQCLQDMNNADVHIDQFLAVDNDANFDSMFVAVVRCSQSCADETTNKKNFSELIQNLLVVKELRKR